MNKLISVTWCNSYGIEHEVTARVYDNGRGSVDEPPTLELEIVRACPGFAYEEEERECFNHILSSL